MKVTNESGEGYKLRNFRFSERSTEMIVHATGVGQKSDTRPCLREKRLKDGENAHKGEDETSKDRSKTICDYRDQEKESVGKRRVKFEKYLSKAFYE